jgi:hypothetical protein
LKIGNVTVDWADIGNACLFLGTGIAAYGVSAGNPLFGVEALAVGGALKAVASVVDNYLFKKNQAAKTT